MDCDDCGKCCEWIAIPMQTRADIELAKVRGLKVIDGYAVIPTKCPYLKDKRCSIYEQRPLLCRTFKPGSKICKIIKERM